MQVTGKDQVELASSQLKDVDHIWYTQWKEKRGTDATPITWKCLCETFLDRFFLGELREEKAQEFMNLRQGSMLVQIVWTQVHPTLQVCSSYGCLFQGLNGQVCI